jgi:hypothetical protein
MTFLDVFMPEIAFFLHSYLELFGHRKAPFLQLSKRFCMQRFNVCNGLEKTFLGQYSVLYDDLGEKLILCMVLAIYPKDVFSELVKFEI